ncbi:MAG: SusC/RagA family TonB-linked outer membrane protein, partial [Saprospiraceae bacterium]
DQNILDEVVVVGYGVQKKKDLTGAVTSVGAEQFQKGNIATPEQLVMGKVAGVQITSNSGQPGSGSRIRIRGGSSLNASNDPLIVIDGVPVDNGTINGASNPLSLINPNDIENITIMKDASAAAIYGARGANGVILITTKKGTAGGKFSIELNSNNSISTVSKYVDVLTGDEFRSLVKSIGTNQQKNLLDTTSTISTDWQREIYRNAFSTDNNLSFTGGVANLPYRLNLGYLKQNGILLRSQMDRYAAGINLSPSFLNNTLKVGLNGKFAQTKNVFTDQGAIGAAVYFDPTKPTHSDTTTLGGYWEWLDNTKKPVGLATRNPLGLINLKDDLSTVNRFIGNVTLDYLLPFVDGLRANLNLGMDNSKGKGTVYIDSTAASQFTRKGTNNQYEQTKTNRLLEFYLNYLKELGINRFDVTAGYSYQNWISNSLNFPDINAVGDTIKAADPFPTKTQNILLSFFGRLNYTLDEKYLLTINLRNDRSSRFSPETRSGWFPSVAVAWRIASEDFLKNVDAISDLKLRLGWGITGQQDITTSDYPYIANYNQSTGTAQTQFGNEFLYGLRPDAYDKNIKWEETTTLNAGLDFGFIKGRINGSIDWYNKNTKDLLALVSTPAGTNFSDRVLTNIGSIENNGLELVLNFVPVASKNTTWELGVNTTINSNKITKLTNVTEVGDEGVLVGGISGGTGTQVQVHTVGYQPFSFFVYEQKYEGGKPLQGQYVDRNNDGVVNENDKYRFHSPNPQTFLGFTTSVRYKNLFANMVWRANIGNYVYNNVASQAANYAFVDGSKRYINNIMSDYFDTEFNQYQYLSDYYVEKASFARFDNLTIGYDFSSMLDKKMNLSVALVGQNLLVISKYKGLDPEIANGIDNNIYPRPRVFSLALNAKF